MEGALVWGESETDKRRELNWEKSQRVEVQGAETMNKGGLGLRKKDTKTKGW